MTRTKKYHHIRKGERLKADFTSKYYVDYIFNRLNSKHGLSYPDISKIISMYHQLAREDYSKGEPIYFKKYMGNLQLWKEKREVIINDKGEVVNTLPINRRATWKLWKEKPELKNKTFVRYVNKHSDGYLFTTSYQISKARFKYKNFYTFKFNSQLKSMLHKNIMNNEVDAFIKKF